VRKLEIKLLNGVVFKDPELRIREYCEIEIYEGYDDQHNISDNITKSDINAANNLFATIDRYDKEESSRIIQHKVIADKLHAIPNAELHSLDKDDWIGITLKIYDLLNAFLSLKGIGLGKAFKILHLKRPKLFPIFDSFVVDFLLQNKSATKDAKLGIMCVDIARKDIINNLDSFKVLTGSLSNLTIPLTIVRCYDILCWTEEKWINRNNLNTPKRIAPSKSLHITGKAIHPLSGPDIHSDTYKVNEQPLNNLIKLSDPKRSKKEMMDIDFNGCKSVRDKLKAICMRLGENGRAFDKQEIIRYAELFEIKRGSVLPSDWCDNTVSGQDRSKKNPFLHSLGKSRYILLK